jgi:NAD(P)-dependent dehydrogenase (short-subunit alcohol dehydrogenase family)
MDLYLQGKKALVTGSSKGIGEAIAKELAHEGVQVVVHGRNKQEIDRVVRDILDAGGKAVGVRGDLAMMIKQSAWHKMLSMPFTV